MNPFVICNRPGFLCKKNGVNRFEFEFTLGSSRCGGGDTCDLTKMITLNIFSLLYELNKDIYERVEIERTAAEDAVVDTEEGQVLLIMNHLFKDLGLPKKHSCLHVTISPLPTDINTDINRKRVRISATPRDYVCPDGDVKTVPVGLESFVCDIISSDDGATLQASAALTLKSNVHIPPFLEKILGQILYKIFSRISQFFSKL